MGESGSHEFHETSEAELCYHPVKLARTALCVVAVCRGMRQPGSRSPLHVKLLMAAGVASMPSRALAQFVAPHKVTFASSDPSAAAAFAVRYLGATRLSGDDGKPGSFRVKAECAAGDTACGDCVVGEWVAFRHTRLNMHDVPRGFVKLGFDSFHLHFVQHSRD